MLNEEVRTRTYNLNLIWISMVILIIGIFNLKSATSGGYEAAYLKVHLTRIGVGFAIALIIYFIHFRVLERFSYAVYVFNIILLVGVLVLGKKVLGAQRWIEIGPFTLQPSELMKISIAWVLAKYFHDDQQRDAYGMRELFLPLVLIFFPALLIMAQPDLGTALIVIAIGAVMILFVKVKQRLFWSVVIITAIAAPLAYTYALKPYQRQRIQTFLNPQADPRGTGYNSIQSMVAVGSGKFLGKGYKKGTQSQLRFLPERHTDFIFSVFSEEHGFLGSGILLALYLALLSTGVKIAHSCTDKFTMLFSVGLVTLFFWHILINICMTIGLMPVVGVPLPFMSFGGSSMVTLILAIGILTNIANRKSMF